MGLGFRVYLGLGLGLWVSYKGVGRSGRAASREIEDCYLSCRVSSGLTTLAQKRLTFRSIVGLYKPQKVKRLPTQPLRFIELGRPLATIEGEKPNTLLCLFICR